MIFEEGIKMKELEHQGDRDFDAPSKEPPGSGDSAIRYIWRRPDVKMMR